MKIVAFVDDLMDRSRLQGVDAEMAFVRSVAAIPPGTGVVLVDLARRPGIVSAVRALLPDAYIVAFGPHVEGELLAVARAAGADRVLARSVFFRDPAAALTRDSD